MSTAYWAQYSHSEIMSMHGVEIDDPEYNESDDDVDYEPKEKYRCDCSNCMDCLGMSWRDFM